MRCFNHSDAEAVGSCRVCFKGLCQACAADLDHSLACKGKHEELASRLGAMAKKAALIQKLTAASFYVAGYATAVFFGLIGILLLAFGIEAKVVSIKIGGVAFLISAPLVAMFNSRVFAKAKAKESAP